MPRNGEIALVGERDPNKPAHIGIEASFALFRVGTEAPRSFRWLGTAELHESGSESKLKDFSGIWVVPGSPYSSTEGALRAIRYAREREIPFLGTCGGFQHALMEYARNVLGIVSVHRELDQAAPSALIVPLACSLLGSRAAVRSRPESWYSEKVGSSESIEEFNCSYGIDASFEPAFEGSEIEFVARDTEGQVRAFRLQAHPFFLGTLFQPERRALTGTFHPLVGAFLQAASL